MNPWLFGVSPLYKNMMINILQQLTNRYLNLFYKNLKYILFFLLLTSGFIAVTPIGYFIHTIITLFFFKTINVEKTLFLKTIILVYILLLSFLITQNQIIIKYIGLITFNYFLYFSTKTFVKKLNLSNLNFILNTVFYIHAFIIIISAIIFRGQTNVRFAGLIGAYDFVSFVLVIFLVGDFEYQNKKFTLNIIFKLFLTIIAIAFSGRFGFIILIFFLIRIFLMNFSFKKSIILFLSLLLILTIFFDKFIFVYDSFIGIYDYLKNGNLDAFNDLYVEDSGYYAASPITWFSEFMRPFANPGMYLFPNKQIAIVDSGISYVFLNLGFILGIYLYFYFTNYFKINKKTFYPFLIIFLLSDIKFRSIFVIFPMFWLFLNSFKISKFKEISE